MRSGPGDLGETVSKHGILKLTPGAETGGFAVMTTDTLTLTDFLLARIADDEAGNDAAVVAEVERCRADGMPDLTEGEVRDYWGEQEWWRRRVAECEAKRRIIDVHQLANADQGGGVGCMHCDWDREWGMPTTGGCDTLRYLATIYADHPDYNPDWRP